MHNNLSRSKKLRSSTRRTSTIERLPDKLEQSLRANPVISELLGGWARLALPECWLVAGAVVQSYWNWVHGYPPLHGIGDVDIIYFDAADLSEAAEAAHAARISRDYRDWPIRLDVKNEARVHLWYEDRFGYSIAPYRSARAAIDTFPTTAGAIGVRPTGSAIECYAAFGYDDLMNLVVRPNKRQITREIYERKAARWQSVWPKLRIVGWEQAQS